MAAAALMMAACSSDEIASVAQKGRTPLEIVPVVKTQTRAAQITTDNLTTLTVDVTGTFVTAGGDNVVNPVLTLTKSGSTWSYTYNGDNAGPIYWPTEAQTAYFSAHTLAGGATVNEATTQQDAIGAYATKEFDGSTNPGTVSLTFKHAVAKMEFKARVNAATSGTVQATIDIKQVAVRNMKYTGTYAIPTATANQDMGVITPTAAVTSLLTDERTSTTFLTKDDAAATSLGSLFMVPQAVTAEDLSNNTWDDAYIAVLAQIRIKNGDADATMLFPSAGAVDNSSYAWVAVPMPADFTQMQAHKKYIFTINFSADALGKVDRNQTPVIPGGGQDIEIEGRSSSPVTVSVEHVYDFDAEGNDVDVNLPTASASVPTGIINGLFSVSATKQVYFSQGNLQAVGTTTSSLSSGWTWQFAEHQWDYIGGLSSSSGSEAQTGNNYINGNGTLSANGTVDLFCWSTNATYYGIHNGQYASTYQGDFYDWGNAMGSGWRTLTPSEWEWILGPSESPTPGTNCRATTSNIRYAKATVNNVKGLIILPDDWSTSYYALTSTNTKDATFTANEIDASTWASSLEAHGAVFLPAAGNRYIDGENNNYVSATEVAGIYWSTVPYDDDWHDKAYQLVFTSEQVAPLGYATINVGFSVRLVKDAE